MEGVSTPHDQAGVSITYLSTSVMSMQMASLGVRNAPSDRQARALRLASTHFRSS